MKLAASLMCNVSAGGVEAAGPTEQVWREGKNECGQELPRGWCPRMTALLCSSFEKCYVQFLVSFRQASLQS